MVYKVVSTKLDEEEHTKLIEACNNDGVTPSAFIRDSIMLRLDPEFLMKRIIERMNADVEWFDRLAGEVNERQFEQRKKSGKLTLADLYRRLGTSPKQTSN
ncbi:MAG TPA: hypothetical protein VJ792_09360 [Candidatus Nitrosotalea sp.]|nr:hypothetical protein [Candidatus Nitrosotalea sp.]